MELVNTAALLLVLALIGWFLLGTARKTRGFAALAADAEEARLPRGLQIALWALIAALGLLRLYRFAR